MNSSIENTFSFQCKKHNELVMFQDSKQEALCEICMSEKYGLIYLKFNKQTHQEMEEREKYKQSFENWYGNFINYKDSLVKCIGDILQVLSNQINSIEQFTQNLYQQQNNTNDLQKQFQAFQSNNEISKSQVRKQITNLESIYIYQWNAFSELNKKPEKQITDVFSVQNQKKFEYEIIDETCELESFECCAFNKESNILVVARKNKIYINQFTGTSILQVIQKLTDHTKNVNCLQFMQNSSQFVSGSDDNSIIVWEFNQNNWFAQAQLKEHKQKVTCIQINNDGNLIISGSVDGTIKFWSKTNKIWNSQQTIETFNQVIDISLNSNEVTLIACGDKNYIQVIHYDYLEKDWRIVQAINVECSGRRLCFTQDDKFIFQPHFSNYIQIYDYCLHQFWMSQSVYFIEKELKEFSFSPYLPCQYIQELNIVAVKHVQNLNIFKIDQNKSFQLIQSINVGSWNFHCRLTEDGQYLVISQYEYGLIQVRKLKCLE